MSQGPPAGSVLQRSVAAPGNQPQSPEDEDRKVRRREKNRVAAQRSRRKQTQKADKLHEAWWCMSSVSAVQGYTASSSSAKAEQRNPASHIKQPYI
ncbi:basic leucine zipper transcriptional factor ATF-like 3 isoform X2 [Meriones unguiculatus]|uniref:basic leucine zipper transcriptional factor ATF-like 3 isoform X2 n=1 Tax=Meriones unguiculatus TaxID=10047 RepID=UPI00293E2F84|nr:basic leucine zipper transcriptional factor ATF-like 3 isoform X2 [Meriones unguiculatus]